MNGRSTLKFILENNEYVTTTAEKKTNTLGCDKNKNNNIKMKL